MSLDDLFSVHNNANTGVTNIRNLKSIQITIASPENIREWSYGEVKNRKRLTIVLSNLKGTVFSALKFSDP